MSYEITSKNETRPQTDVARLSGSPSQHHTINFQPLFHSSPKIQCRSPRQTAHWYMHWVIDVKDHYNIDSLRSKEVRNLRENVNTASHVVRECKREKHVRRRNTRLFSIAISPKLNYKESANQDSWRVSRISSKKTDFYWYHLRKAEDFPQTGQLTCYCVP